MGARMDQDGIRQSTRTIHSPTSYTADFSNKSYKAGTLHVSVSHMSTINISDEDTMINVLRVAMI